MVVGAGTTRVVILLVLACLAVPSKSSNSGNCTSSFEHSLMLTDRYELQWNIMENIIQIKLSLLTDSRVRWIGFGLSEAGRMIGSDLVTVLRREDDIEEFEVHDRNVPWVPYMQQPSPEIDKYNNWQLECASSDDNFFMAVLRRQLHTLDGQDREIKKGYSHSVIYAWGNKHVVGYHGPNRGTAKVTFFGAEEDPTPPDEITDDAAPDSSVYLLTPRYKLKGITSQYVCQSFDLGSPTRHIIEIQPVFERSPAMEFLDQIVVYASGDDPGAKYYSMHSSEPGPCGGDLDKYEGATLLGVASSTVLFTWSLGSSSLVLPPEAGFRIGDFASRYILMEVHFNNPDKNSHVLASNIGVAIFTTTVLRKFDATSLILGDPGMTLSADDQIPLFSDWSHYETTCSSSCTSNFHGDITIFASMLHMHQHGRQIWTTLSKYNEDSDQILSVDIIDYRQFWSMGYHSLSYINYELSQGDSLNTHCVYDTSAASSSVSFGPSTDKEVCMHFLFVYPAAHVSAHYCGRSKGGYSLCSESTVDQNFICKKNPVADGTINVPDDLAFGVASNTSASSVPKHHQVVHSKNAIEIEPSTSTPSIGGESSLVTELTCVLYDYKEKMRYRRLEVAIGFTVLCLGVIIGVTALFVFLKDRCCSDDEYRLTRSSSPSKRKIDNRYEMVPFRDSEQFDSSTV